MITTYPRIRKNLIFTERVCNDGFNRKTLFSKLFRIGWLVKLSKLSTYRMSKVSLAIKIIISQSAVFVGVFYVFLIKLYQFGNFTGKHLCQSLFFNKVGPGYTRVYPRSTIGTNYCN